MRLTKRMRAFLLGGAVWIMTMLLAAAIYLDWIPTAGAQTLSAPGSGELQVHYLDVGQADCILIRTGGHDMLIDAGNNDDAAKICDYLASLGVRKLDFLLLTHPHEDHIGGADEVVYSLPIETVIMPEKEHTSKSFEDVLDALEHEGLSVTAPVPGQAYALGAGAFTVLSPLRDYGDDLNDWSVCIRLVFGQTSFYMAADKDAENDILDAGLTLKSDVLKVAHHGSDTSSGASFLDAVAPEFAVISCGRLNVYGHPHEETMQALLSRGVKLFRTDEQGTVVAFSDGQAITWSCGPSELYTAGSDTIYPNEED